ncbi:tellurium resistance protein [Lentzea sp. NPDC004782]|uniref:TerD family protein n=1 Tax=Lentzea sp. NPDC004782 TaxID=3154458 RepID=UPI0033B43E5C
MAIDYTKRTGDGSTGTVLLTKSKPSVSLHKQASGLLRVNLNWNARPAPKGAAGLLRQWLAPADIDLDLGCLYEFADGTKGVVQALGNSFSASPSGLRDRVIWLDGDDRSGSNSAGENLYVDLAHAARIRRMVVFSYIYEGVPNWAAADGVVTLHPVSGPVIEVRLDEPDDNARMCAVAMIEQSGTGSLTVRREVRYLDGAQRRLDEEYGWGLRWTAGRK